MEFRISPDDEKRMLELHKDIEKQGKLLAMSVFEYSRGVCKSRLPDYETLILRYPYISYLYARDVIRGRWEQAEPSIVQHLPSFYFYATDVLQRRWIEKETEIVFKSVVEDDVSYGGYSMRDSCYYVMNYIGDFIKGRWEHAEPYIAKHPEYAFWYAENIIKGRWKECEYYMIEDIKWATVYARYVIKGRWPELEDAITDRCHRLFPCVGYYRHVSD